MPPSPLDATAKTRLVDRLLGRKAQAAVPDGAQAAQPGAPALIRARVPEAYTRFDRHPAYERLLVPKAAAARLGLRNPFFIAHDGVAGALTRIGGREYVNYSSYNYLGLCGHPAIGKAAKDAIDRYGTSASASRLVAGERPIQRELEEALAAVYGVDDCVVFVSGHATNVSTIGCLFGPKDLIVHDSLAHNSVVEGARLAGAVRRSFPHNDLAALDALLADVRGQFERALIVVEGHYGMDGDTADLPALVELKRRHGCFLMVDEAHALGVLGPTGKGLHEHHRVPGRDVDIWMGTLSKTLAGCGGY
jgi:8-amino-7-oxononanoate synthase